MTPMASSARQGPLVVGNFNLPARVPTNGSAGQPVPLEKHRLMRFIAPQSLAMPVPIHPSTAI